MPEAGTCTAAESRRTQCEFTSLGDPRRGWFYPPDSPPPYACVVMAHGFGRIPDLLLSEMAEGCAECGLAAFTFDVRGRGATGATPGAKPDRQLDDWEAAIAYVRSREDVDPDLVGLWGSSFSGAQVLTVAARDPRIGAAVARVPSCRGFSPARAASVVRKLPVLPALVRNLLHDSLLELYRFHPPYRADDVRCPLLVVLSYDDQIAPPEAAMRLARRSPSVELALFHAQHDLVVAGETRERALRTELTFMTYHLDRSRAGD